MDKGYSVKGPMDTKLWMHVEKQLDPNTICVLEIDLHHLPNSKGFLDNGKKIQNIKGIEFSTTFEWDNIQKAFPLLMDPFSKIDIVDLGHRKFRLVDSIKRHLSIETKIYLKAVLGDKHCSILLRPHCLEESRCTLNDKETTLDLKRLGNLDREKLLDLLRDSTPHFSIKLRRGPLKHTNLVKLFPKFLDLSIKNTPSLSRLVKLPMNGNSFNDMASKLFEVSKEEIGKLSITTKTSAEICEMKDFLLSTDSHTLVSLIVNNIHHNTITSVEDIYSLIKIFKYFKCINDPKLIELIKGFSAKKDKLETDSEEFLVCLRDQYGIHPQNLLELFKVCLKKISIFKDPSMGKISNDFAVLYLEFSSILLDLMIGVGMTTLEREEFENFLSVLKAINQNNKSHEAKISFLTEYCEQALYMLPPSELDYTKDGVISLFKGIGKLLSGFDPLAPWHLFTNVFDAIPDFIDASKAFIKARKITDSKTTTSSLAFQYLFILRRIVESSTIKFFPDIENGALKIQDRELFNQAFFVRGYVELLSNILESPDLSKHVIIECLMTLDKIACANQSITKKSHEKKLFELAPTDQTELLNLIYKVLGKFQEHKDEHVQDIFRNLQCKPRKSHVPKTNGHRVSVDRRSGSNPSSPTLFYKAAQVMGFEPIEWRIAKEVASSLKNDDTFQLKLPTYVPLYAKNRIDTKARPIEAHIEEFKNNPKQKVMLFSGVKGSGKSFISKFITWQELMSYNPDDENDWLFVYVSPEDARTRLKDFSSNKDEQKRLKNKKIIWIIDGYDERNEGKAQLELRNYYVTNHMRRRENWKLLIVSRTGFCEDSYFEPEEKDKELVCLDFLSPIEDAGECYKRFLTKNNGLLQAEDFSDIVNKLYRGPEGIGDEMVEIIGNPLLLSALIYTLPTILEDLKIDYPTYNILDVIKTEKAEKHVEIMNSLKEKLHEVFAIVCAWRQTFKSMRAGDNTTTVTAEECINYSIQIAKAFKLKEYTADPKFIVNYGINVLHYDATKEALLRTSCLHMKGGTWKFFSESYFEFFLNLSQNPEAVNRLLTYLKTNKYDYKHGGFSS